MTSRPVLFLAAACLALTACTGSSEEPSAPEAAGPQRPSDCPVAEEREVPAECVEDSDDFDFVPTPSGSAPSGSDAIAPVALPPAPGDLAAGGNDQDPSKTTETFTVTVPAGSRLRTTAACEGRNDIDVSIEPESAAAQTFQCGSEGFPAELTVEDSVPVTTATRFTVTVTTTPPARWYVAVGATSEAAPPDPALQG